MQMQKKDVAWRRSFLWGLHPYPQSPAARQGILQRKGAKQTPMNPYEAVASGAAVQAVVLSGNTWMEVFRQIIPLSRFL